MFCLRRILVSILIIAYPLALQSDYALARRTSKRASKKSSKKKTKRASKSKSIEKEEISSVIEENVSNGGIVSVSTTETTATTTTTTQASSTADVATNTSASDEIETVVSGEIQDMSKDEKWEEFRICMQTSCAGSDEQPNNVECYKSLTFDNVFMNCKMLVDEDKREAFRNYFTGPFIRNEKKTFCEGDQYGGKFDEVSGKCAITVKYTRPAYNGKKFHCAKESKSLTWYIDNRNYVCDASLFNVENCYQDSENYTSAKIKAITGSLQLVGAAATGIVAGISAGKQMVNTSVKTEGATTINADGSKTTTETVYNKEKAGVLAGVQAGLQSSSGLLTSGASDVATAMILANEKGKQIFGVCNLPNGEVIQEGNSIKLSW